MNMYYFIIGWRIIIHYDVKEKSWVWTKDGLTLQRGALLRFVDEEKGEITEGLFIGPEDNSDFVVVPLSETMLLKKEGRKPARQMPVAGRYG